MSAFLNAPNMYRNRNLSLQFVPTEICRSLPGLPYVQGQEEMKDLQPCSPTHTGENNDHGKNTKTLNINTQAHYYQYYYKRRRKQRQYFEN